MFSKSQLEVFQWKSVVGIRVNQHMTVGTNDGEIAQSGNAGSVGTCDLFEVMNLKHSDAPAI